MMKGYFTTLQFCDQYTMCIVLLFRCPTGTIYEYQTVILIISLLH
jgi:hypothetical protein